MEVLQLNPPFVSTCKRHRPYQPAGWEFRSHVAAHEEWLQRNPAKTSFYEQQQQFYTRSTKPDFVSEKFIQRLASDGIEAAQRILNPKQRAEQQARAVR